MSSNKGITEIWDNKKVIKLFKKEKLVVFSELKTNSLETTQKDEKLCVKRSVLRYCKNKCNATGFF